MSGRLPEKPVSSWIANEETWERPLMTQNVNGTFTLTRDELYKQVWATPMRRLAKSYGLSDVGLAKLCKRHKIPRPPVGFWAKKQAGKKIAQPPLPELDDSTLEKITIWRHQRPSNQELDSGTRKLIHSERKPENIITVKKRLVSPHRLVAKTATSLRDAEPNERGLVRSYGDKTLNVSVGPRSIGRAMRILDALIKALESRSFRVAVEDEYKSRTVVYVNDDAVEFALTEKLTLEIREMTPSERRNRFWSSDTTVRTHHLTGRLSLQILTYRGDLSRRTWTDGKKQRLESCLNAFIVAVIETADALKRQRLECEEAHRKREAWEAERARKLEMIRDEENRVERLELEVRNWHRSQLIREYVKTIRAAVRDGSCDIHDDEDLARWAQWALAQADRIDPLVESPESILDDKDKWDRSYYRDWYR